MSGLDLLTLMWGFWRENRRRQARKRAGRQHERERLADQLHKFERNTLKRSKKEALRALNVNDDTSPQPKRLSSKIAKRLGVAGKFGSTFAKLAEMRDAHVDTTKKHEAIDITKIRERLGTMDDTAGGKNDWLSKHVVSKSLAAQWAQNPHTTIQERIGTDTADEPWDRLKVAERQQRARAHLQRLRTERALAEESTQAVQTVEPSPATAPVVAALSGCMPGSFLQERIQLRDTSKPRPPTPLGPEAASAAHACEIARLMQTLEERRKSPGFPVVGPASLPSAAFLDGDDDGSTDGWSIQARRDDRTLSPGPAYSPSQHSHEIAFICETGAPNHFRSS